MTSDSVASPQSAAIQTITRERTRSKRATSARLSAWLLSSGLVTFGCAGILGIEDAECDSDFAPECGGIPNAGSGGNGASGAGGLTGNGGTGGSSGVGGSGGGGAGGGGSGGMSGAGGAAPLSLCEQYCNRVESSCVDANRQYASREACLAVCGLLDAGEAGVLTGNTVRCRLNQAQFAATTGEPGMHCFASGPGGAGVCGEDCEGYCTLMSAKCTQLGTYTECLEACDEVPDLSQPPNNVRFSASIDEGDSLQCRLYHVSAATLDPVLHCPHAGGAAPCAP
jgi:hypothetical protein